MTDASDIAVGTALQQYVARQFLATYYLLLQELEAIRNKIQHI